jgi:hypothetical protein
MKIGSLWNTYLKEYDRGSRIQKIKTFIALTEDLIEASQQRMASQCKVYQSCVSRNLYGKDLKYCKR